MITDLPMEALRQIVSDDGAIARFEPRCFLVCREEIFRKHREEFLGLDRDGGEEIFGILIDAAKPRLMRHGRHAGDAGDALVVTQGERLDNGNLVPNHEPIRTHHADSAGEARFDGAEECEE